MPGRSLTADSFDIVFWPRLILGNGPPVVRAQVAHLPPPTAAAACLEEPINHNQSKERRPQDLNPSPSRRAGTGELQQPSKQVGHSRVSKWAIPACQKQSRLRIAKNTNSVGLGERS